MAGSSGFTEFTEFASRWNYTYPDFPVKIDLISVSCFFQRLYVPFLKKACGGFHLGRLRGVLRPENSGEIDGFDN
jgi:hypothetical protein